MTDQPANPRPKAAGQAARDARRAEALRANLRRRKVAARAGEEPSEAQESPEAEPDERPGEA